MKVLNVVGPNTTKTGKKDGHSWAPGPGEIGYREKWDFTGSEDFEDGPAVLREYPNECFVLADNDGVVFGDENYGDPDNPSYLVLDKSFSGCEEARKYLESLPESITLDWLREQGFYLQQL